MPVFSRVPPHREVQLPHSSVAADALISFPVYESNYPLAYRLLRCQALGRASRSSKTERIMTTPTAVPCQNGVTFNRFRPLLRTPIRNTPISVPIMLPFPPKSDVPPITT